MTAIDGNAAGKRDLVQPNPDVADKLWMIVVRTFAIVVVATAAALIYLVIEPTTSTVRPELVLSLFTSATGFLAGLFVPAPQKKEGRQ